MVDIRLYIGTLVAVLVFFGLGVLVGIGITREPRAEQLYQRIERQLRQYREETARELKKRDEKIRQLDSEIVLLRSKLRANEQFVEKIAPSLVQGKLMFRNIAIVLATTDANGELVLRVQSFLEKAGAKVPLRITLVPEVIQKVDSLTWRKIAEGLGLIVSNVDDKTVKTGIWKRAALLIRYGDPQNYWQVLSKAGLVKVSGDTQTPVGSVVLLCTDLSQRDDEQIKEVDLLLLQALKSVGIRTAVATSSLLGDEVVAFYRLEDLTIVEHVDTPLGLLSLVAALLGHHDHYGFSEAARRPFPEPNWFVQQSRQQ